MESSQNLGIPCCISSWHTKSGKNFHDNEINSSNLACNWNLERKVLAGDSNGTEGLERNDDLVNSGPNGRRKFRIFLESNIQNECFANLLTVSRLLSEWRKDNEIKNSFVMELIDFTRLCGVKRNVTYNDLFELLSKLFENKLKMKKINDNYTYKKFDLLASKCVRLINIPQLLDSIIMVLTKFNRLPDKILNELTTPDLYLFPSFLSFYKLAPIKLRQQMWLKRPDWFVYEILPFIMLFVKLSLNFDCCSIDSTVYDYNRNESNPLTEINALLKKLKTDLDRNNCTNLRKNIEGYIFDSLNMSQSSRDTFTKKYLQYSDSVDSIFSFISRIRALYISCVELEHGNIELFGDSCKCLAFNHKNSFEFYKSFFLLQKNEKFASSKCVNVNVGDTNYPDPTCASANNCSHVSCSGRNKLQRNSMDKSSNKQNSVINNLNICENVLKLGRIVAYISHCIGNYKELYACFVNTIKQLYIDSLSHNIGSKAIQNYDYEKNKWSIAGHECVSLKQNSHFVSRYQSQTQYNSTCDELVDLNKEKNECESFKHELEHEEKSIKDFIGDPQNFYFDDEESIKQHNYQFECKLNNFSGEPSLATLRIFVALRIFNFENKICCTEDDDMKVSDLDRSTSEKKISDLNSEKLANSNLSKFEVHDTLTISECDPITWPCIHIIGNILRDGFSSIKSQELLVNVSSTLVIKSNVELADIAFVFSEPHFLFICSEFILETSILTMFHSSMDAQLVLNPQRRKIPIALILLGLNSTFLNHKIREHILGDSNFLYLTNYNSFVTNIPFDSTNIGNKTNNTQIYNLGNLQYADVLSDINIQSSLKKKPRKFISNDLVSGNNDNCNNLNQNFAIRLDTLLNMLTSFNIEGNHNDRQFEIKNEPIKYLNNTQYDIDFNILNHTANPMNNTNTSALNNLIKLKYTVFTTFLPLIDRYLELSISSEKKNMSNLGEDTEFCLKMKKNEILKSYRNELMEYIGSLLSKEHCYSNDLTLKFVRLISSSLFFTGVKPTFIRYENSQIYHTTHSNVIGLYYGHFHNTSYEVSQNTSSFGNQISIPLLPSCINLSIRLLETSFCLDWVNQVFLKSILGLLHTYPKLPGNPENGNLDEDYTISKAFNNRQFSMFSLFASIPKDIIQGLLFRIVLPSIEDPLISSFETNIVNEIIINKEISMILDDKIRKLFIEKLWLRNPFQFVIHYRAIVDKKLLSEHSQRLQMKDIYQCLVESSTELKEIKEIILLLPYKAMIWEHHFIENNDTYLVFIKWLIYFQKLCNILDKEYQISSKFCLISDLINSFENKLDKAKL